MTGIICSIAGATYARAARTITTVGTAQVDTAQSQFGGASLLLDDSPEAYLTVAHSADLLTGTGAFTVEGWFRPALAAAAGQSVGTRFWFFKGVNSNTGFGLGVTTDGVRFRGPGTTDLAYTAAISSSVFTHIAFVWDGTNKKIYVNGTEQATSGASINVTNTSNYQIGYVTGDFAYNGHIDEIRVSNSLRYSTTFTPTATPFTFDVNTLLLIHADGTDATTVFTDDVGVRSPAGISAVGNAQVDTAQSQFGDASALFDGTGDYLETGGNADFDLASTDFTVEGWFRKTVTVNAGLIGNYEFNTSGGFSLFTWTTNSLLIGSRNSADTGLQFYQSAINVSTDSQFNHFAVCRSGLNMQVYCEGTRVINRTDFYIKNWATASDAKITVGRSAGSAAGTWSDADYVMNGHMDEIRVSKITRYSGATYTEPTAAFTNDVDTVLLVHCNGVDASTTFTDDVG